MIVRTDGTPVDAAELMELMVRRAPAMQGETYRFSPPPAHSAAWREADALSRARTGQPFCAAGGHNCVNVPIDIHPRALGGVPLAYHGSHTDPHLVGTVPDAPAFSLADPAHASARDMSAFMSVPDEELARWAPEPGPAAPWWGS